MPTDKEKKKLLSRFETIKSEFHARHNRLQNQTGSSDRGLVAILEKTELRKIKKEQ